MRVRRWEEAKLLNLMNKTLRSLARHDSCSSNRKVWDGLLFDRSLRVFPDNCNDAADPPE